VKQDNLARISSLSLGGAFQRKNKKALAQQDKGPMVTVRLYRKNEAES
jgi:hypothetical protein